MFLKTVAHACTPSLPVFSKSSRKKKSLAHPKCAHWLDLLIQRFKRKERSRDGFESKKVDFLP